MIQILLGLALISSAAYADSSEMTYEQAIAVERIEKFEIPEGVRTCSVLGRFEAPWNVTLTCGGISKNSFNSESLVEVIDHLKNQNFELRHGCLRPKSEDFLLCIMERK